MCRTFLFSLTLAVFGSVAARADELKPLSRIAFGSCVHQDKPQPIWSAIVAARPELMLLLGDNIYVDYPKQTPFAEAYEKLANQPEFAKLRSSCPIMATWDDHDYGLNDAGVEYPNKDESKKLFLTFFKEPTDSPRWKRAGVYDAKIFGPEGKRVQVIMLDGRYNRSPLKKGRRGLDPAFPRVEPYVATTDPEATFLGEEQWTWLAEQLKQPAEIRLICSGIQVISEDHIFEKWMNIPHERERLFRTIRETRAAGVVFLSGDRHMADLSVMDGGVGYLLYDVTASGFNQASTDYRPPEKNRHRVGTMSWGNHFGFIEIDWTRSDPLLSLQIRDEAGQVACSHKLPLSALVPKQEKPVKPVGPGAISTADAQKKVGEKVTVELTVSSTGMAGNRVFLNSEKDRRSEKNFPIVIEMDKAGAKFKEKKIDAPGKHFAGKTIRVSGTVTKFKDTPQIVVTDPEQISLVEK